MNRKLSLLFALSVAIVCGIHGLIGCKNRNATPPDILFVRDGVMLRPTDRSEVIDCRINDPDGKTVSMAPNMPNPYKTGNGGILLPFAWRTDTTYKIAGHTASGNFALEAKAPVTPSPVLISAINLENITHYEGRGFNPDTYVRFSPDETFLAIGSFFGYLRVVSLPTGKIVLEKRLAESMVKRICWSRQNRKRVLFVGEQSPDAFVYAMDPFTGGIFWKYRLADDIGFSKPESGDPRLRVYNMPGPYVMQALPDGDLLLVGLHGRYQKDLFVYDSRVYRLDGATGKIKWKWPRDQTLPYGITWASASTDGRVIGLLTDTWLSVKKAHPQYKNGALYCLNGENGRVNWEYHVPPLKPYYEKAATWQGIAVSPEGRYLALGLNDGRGMLFDGTRLKDQKNDVTPLWTKNIGTPVMNGNVPVAAAIAYAALTEDAVYFALPGTTIPPNSASSDKQSVPAPHPRSHSVCAYSLSGKPFWQWQCSGSTQGLFVSDNGRWVATAITDDRGAADPDDFGMALFDTMRTHENEAGKDPLVYRYFTKGCVFFMGAVSKTGKYIVICEYPFSPDNGKTRIGDYRVHVVH